MTQNEHTNRARKAIAIAAALRTAGADHESATELDDAGWQVAAKVAAHQRFEATGRRHDWTDASPETRRIVIELLADIPAVISEIAASPERLVDPAAVVTERAVQSSQSAVPHTWTPIPGFMGCKRGCTVCGETWNCTVGAEPATSCGGTPAGAGHKTEIHTDPRTWSLGHIAHCSCGWQGPYRTHKANAEDDERAHQSNARNEDDRALAAAVDQAIARQHPSDPIDPDEMAFLNWCEIERWDPTDPDTLGAYLEWLELNDRQCIALNNRQAQ
jgi:hypothetical protein